MSQRPSAALTSAATARQSPAGRRRSSLTAVLRAALLMLVGGALALAASSRLKAHQSAPSPTALATTYYCPMHPQITADRPGDCPICNMRLVPRSAAPAPGRPSTAAPAPARYQCPMHPQIIAEEKGACPICGMQLAPMPEPPHLTESSALPAAAPPSGYVSVLLDPQRRQLLGIQRVAVRRTQLAGTLRTAGRLTYDETRLHHVHTRYEAYIEAVYADFTGKFVKKGEPLLSLYSPELLVAQQEYLIALGSQRGGLQLGPGAGGATLIEAARQKLLLLHVSPTDIAQLESSGQANQTLRVDSPVSGYVVGKVAVHGMRVRPEDSLFDIVDLSQLWVLADVYEYDLPRLQLGLAATMTLSYWPGRSWPAKVSYIYPAVDPKTRTVKVRLEVKNPREELKAEMYADVVLSLAPRSALVLPDDAVIETGTRKLVFVLGPQDSLEPREVELGDREGGQLEVKSGLREGEQVARGASFLLDSESRLQSALTGLGTPPPAAAREAQ
jgi:Cu(I)/Ag(I) efflux system membrane fusion protein